jgi:hypothetical protein
MPDLKNPSYYPDRLLDFLLEKLGLSSDAKLAIHVGTAATMISKMRNRRLPLGPSFLVRMSEEVGMPIGALRELAGLPRRMYIGA